MGFLESGLSGVLFPERTKKIKERKEFADKITLRKHERLEEQQQRITRQDKIANLKDFGGSVTDEKIKDLGIDFEMYSLSGGAEPINTKTGRVWKVLPRKDYDRKVSEKKFTTEEEKFFTNISDENTRWTGVIRELGNLGITKDTANQFDSLGKIGKIGLEAFNSPFGVISLPARFDLVGQYAKDPKYTAVKRAIEQAFQAFRKRTTGAQASDREIKILREIMPALQDRPSVFFSTIELMLQENNNVATERLKLYRAFGRDISQLEELFAKPGEAKPIKMSDKLGIKEEKTMTMDDIRTTAEEEGITELDAEKLLRKKGFKLVE